MLHVHNRLQSDTRMFDKRLAIPKLVLMWVATASDNRQPTLKLKVVTKVPYRLKT